MSFIFAHFSLLQSTEMLQIASSTSMAQTTMVTSYGWSFLEGMGPVVGAAAVVGVALEGLRHAAQTTGFLFLVGQ